MDKAKAQRFTQFLIKKYGEDGAKKKIQKIQKTGKVDEEDIKDFAASEQKQQQQQTQKAAHGAKLNYFKSLKNQCAEDEEVVYFKKGGSVTCGCKKKEQGGEVPTAKQGSAIEKFKKARKAATGTEFQKPPFKQETPEKKEGWDKHGNYIVSKKKIEERKKQLESNKNEEGKVDPKKTQQQKTPTKQGGSKLAIMKAPRTKIDHMKKGSAIEKFKAAKCGSKLKKHLQGGSLNRIPFIRKAQ